MGARAGAVTAMGRIPVAIAVVFVSVLALATVTAHGGAVLVAQRGSGARSQRAPTSHRAAPQTSTDTRTLVRGRVTDVDSTTGRVAIDVNGTVLEARYPAEMASELKVGDVVFVDVTIINTSQAVVPGSVAAVDDQKRAITITTPKGPLTVPVASAGLDRIRTGDEVMLRLGLVDIGPPP